MLYDSASCCGQANGQPVRCVVNNAGSLLLPGDGDGEGHRSRVVCTGDMKCAGGRPWRSAPGLTRTDGMASYPEIRATTLRTRVAAAPDDQIMCRPPLSGRESDGAAFRDADGVRSKGNATHRDGVVCRC